MADEGTEPREETSERPDRRRAHLRWGLVALVLLAGAVGVLVYQNIGAVPVRAFWWEFSIPLVVVIVATAVVTLVIEALLGVILRWRTRWPRRDRKPRSHRNGGPG